MTYIIYIVVGAIAALVIYGDKYQDDESRGARAGLLGLIALVYVAFHFVSKYW